MEAYRLGTNDTWLKLTEKQTYKSWCALAFESICIKYLEAIEKAIGIHAIHTQASVWRSSKKNAAAQIDLLIDRNDKTINLYEIKFYNSEFTIDKKYASALRKKATIFRENTGTKKQIIWVLIAPFGIHKNGHSIGLVDNTIQSYQIFAKIAL